VIGRLVVMLLVALAALWLFTPVYGRRKP